MKFYSRKCIHGEKSSSNNFLCLCLRAKMTESSLALMGGGGGGGGGGKKKKRSCVSESRMAAGLGSPSLIIVSLVVFAEAKEH